MRTTLDLDDEWVQRARALSGLGEKTAVVHAGLEALIARESARRLAALGGSEPGLLDVRRRRSRPAALKPPLGSALTTEPAASLRGGGAGGRRGGGRG
jgi:Arc/MetJ family transcription regulator